MIVIIEELFETTIAEAADHLRALKPRLILVDMCGPQATYLEDLRVLHGFNTQALPKAVKRRVE